MGMQNYLLFILHYETLRARSLFPWQLKLPLCEGNVSAMRDNKADCQITGSIAIQEMFPHQTAGSLTGVVLAPGYSPLYAWELFQGRHGKKNAECKWS